MWKKTSRMVTVLMLAFQLAIAGIIWSVDNAGAQSQPLANQQTGNQVTITDAGGRTHKVMRMNTITQAQRKAAAKRAKARVKKANQQKPGQPTKNEVTK